MLMNLVSLFQKGSWDLHESDVPLLVGFRDAEFLTIIEFVMIEQVYEKQV